MADTIFVASIDFGTMFSGWAYMLAHELKTEPMSSHIREWNSGSSITEKTPTVVLVKPNGNELEAFGYDAEDRYQELHAKNEHKNYYYFQRFKMKLHKKFEETVDLNMELKDKMGRTLPALDVFSMAIKYLVDDFHSKTKDKLLGGILPSDIHWVITVPAIWTDSAKDFMRKAGEKAGIDGNKLSIALEPEAASIFYRYSQIQRQRKSTGAFVDRFKEGTKYMVLDAGGGTIDVTVHEVQPNGKLKEIKAASGGGWGGCLVDKEFKKAIIDIVGNDVFRVFKKKQIGDWLEFSRSFEFKKRAISPDKDTKVVMSVPFSLWNTYEVNNQSFKKAVKSTHHAENIKALENVHKLEFQATFFRNLFTNSLEKIIQHTESILRDPDVGKVSAILMVGGFSESPMLQQSIKTSFHDIEVIVPKEASTSVLRGALICGFNPNLISERVLRHTYGVSCYTKFIEGEHPESRRVMTDSGPKCRDKFDKHVEINQIVKVGEPQITKTYTPINRDQRNITFSIYGSKMKDPKYTDEDCILIGKIDMELSNHDGDLSRELKVCFTFSGTEIVVSAHDLKTGTYKKGPLDYPR